MNEYSDIEKALCRLHDRKHCVLIGNGTSGLTICLQALGLKKKKVAIPDSVCLSVPIAVHYSGNSPVYLDIECTDYGLSRSELREQVHDYDAVIAVHGYGAVCNMQEIEAIASTAGLPVIEDACLAQGGKIGSRPAGSFGIASVLSFGVGKPISINHGGAVMTDDSALYKEIVTLVQRLPEYESKDGKAIDALGMEHTRIYNAHYEKDLECHLRVYQQRIRDSKGSFLHAFDASNANYLRRGLERLSHIVWERNARWRLFKDKCNVRLKNKVSILDMPYGSVPWRFSLLIEHRDQAMRLLHKNSLKASSWHPRASTFLGGMGGNFQQRLPVSDLIASKVLNLWVDDSVDDAYVEKTIFYLQDLCKFYHQTLI